MSSINEHFALDLLISEARLAKELKKRLPETIIAGKSVLNPQKTWKASFENSRLQINGQLAVMYPWKRGMKLFANLNVQFQMEWLEFPHINLDIQKVELADSPKLHLFGFLKLPIRWLAEPQIKRQLPDFNREINKQINSTSFLQQLQENFTDQLPPDLQIDLAGMQWDVRESENGGQLHLVPNLDVKVSPSDQKFQLIQPFENLSQPINLELHLSIDQVNQLIQDRNPQQQIKTPAGTFTLEKINASIMDNKLRFLVDFAEDKNGQLLLMGHLKIMNSGKGIAYEVEEMNWESVNILKQGIFSLFEQKVKSIINEALQFKQEKIQKLIAAQKKNVAQMIIPDNNGEIKTLQTQLHFQKAKIIDNSLRISATLVGELIIEVD